MLRLWLLSLPLVLPTCADEEPPPERMTAGVNDVRTACELRARWTRQDTGDCATCRAAVVLPACGCERVRDFEAKCVTLADARRAHPQCTEALDACVAACDPADCDCLDGCYQGADGCRQVTAARDGCIAEICAPYCE